MKRLRAILLFISCVLLAVLVSCIGREAAQRQMGEDSPKEIYHTVTFYQGDMILAQMPVVEGGMVEDVPQGHVWRDGSGRAVDPAAMTIVEDMAFYVREPFALQTGHVRYLTGTDQLFRPEDHLTRGEAARMICMLLDQKAMAEIPERSGRNFDDVPADSAYASSIRLVSAMGLMNGYLDGTFRPEADITRSELLTVLCRVMGLEELQAIAFQDVTAEHWSLGAVAAATTAGWINGYGDGDFYPDAPITRAETVTLVNRVCGRVPNRAAIDVFYEQSPYVDVPKSHWAYYDIVDVSNNSALLAYVMGEVEGVEPGFLLIGEDMCHVNDSLKLDYFQKGFHTIQDGLPTDGLYYVPEDGYFIQRSEPGLQELDGSMFYVEKADGPFLTNYDLGYLHFGDNGRYTSGDEKLDTYVDNFMADIIQGDTGSLLNETKLREAFNRIAKTNEFDYMTRNTGWKRGSTSWSLQCGRVMYATKRGSCFYWAAAFLYAARRLGYQAYPICGGVFSNNALHAWVMIDEDGIEYIYDVELDWAFRTGAHGRTARRYGMDMFKLRRGYAGITYIFPGDTYVAPPQDDQEQFGDEPAIIWPSEFGSPAYLEVDGEMIVLETTWSEMIDDAGILTGYLVTAVYNGVTYSTIIPVAPPPVDTTPTPPVDTTPDPGTTPTPPVDTTPDPGTNTPAPPVDTTPVPPVDTTPDPGTSTPDPGTNTPDPGTNTPPVVTEQPPVVTEQPPVVTEQPVDPQPVVPDPGGAEG